MCAEGTHAVSPSGELSCSRQGTPMQRLVALAPAHAALEVARSFVWPCVRLTTLLPCGENAFPKIDPVPVLCSQSSGAHEEALSVHSSPLFCHALRSVVPLQLFFLVEAIFVVQLFAVLSWHYRCSASLHQKRISQKGSVKCTAK